MSKYERIEHGIAKKWEFIYRDDYFTMRLLYPLREGKVYTVIYDKKKNEIYVDSKNNILIRRKNLTLYSEYKEISNSFFRDVYLKSQKPKIKYPAFKRYFAKFLLEESSGIFETSGDMYAMESFLYKKVSLLWIIEGKKEDVLRENKKAIEDADKTLKAMMNFLNPLEFYKEDISPEDELRKRLDKLKFGTESVGIITPVQPANGGNGGITGY